MLKGKSYLKVKGLMLLCLSVIILILIRQQQATIPSGSEGTVITSKRQPQGFWPFENLQWPPLRGPSANRPSEKIDPASLAAGMHLVIKLSDRRVYVYQNKTLKVSYAIAVGKAGWETPTGNYKVMDMQPNPIWEHPFTGEVILEGPDNPLGARWIAFWTDGRNSIGFHGTPDENLVGQAVSHGCIRMRNQDIVALYAQVKMGTPVTVKP
jgi:lipoprotein-anchoring transpeptidase ErfK/SrfK